MASFFSEQDLTFEQVQCLTSAMYAVAKVDGVHDREMSLIRDFYDGCAGSDAPTLEAVVGQGFDIETAKTLFSTPPLASLLVKSLILLAYADGKYEQVEDELIQEYGHALGLSDEQLSDLKDATKEHLLASLSHVQNVEALTDVAKNLSLN
jgi:uncharacterized tellurite resistance protein B-like protein